MRLAQKIHTEPALTNTAADGIRQFLVQDRLLERQLRAFRTACQRKLSFHRVRVNANAHRGKFKGSVEHLVPKDDIAVQFPVIIVRRTAVVSLSGGQQPADLHDKNSAMLLGDDVFSLFRRLVRIQILQLLRRDKKDLVRNLGLDIAV